MIPHLSDAQHLGNHRVWLRFEDGTTGEVDLVDEIEGEVFEPLADAEYFGRFEIVGWTLTWPNGADFAPEFLYEKVQATRAA